MSAIGPAGGVTPGQLELALSDTQLSLATVSVCRFHLIAGLFIARLVDRGNRIRILAFGVAGWSIATAATGLSHDFFTLSLARIGVGIGEATAFPAALSLIPDLFRPQVRGRSVAIFQSSTFVGIVAGTILAGLLAAMYGWRQMFMLCGAAGVVLAIVLLPSARANPRRAASALHAHPIVGLQPVRPFSDPRVLALRRLSRFR